MLIANDLFFAQVEQTLAEGHEVQLRVKGHSMRPLLRSERDAVVLTPYCGELLHIGDIVLFRYAGRHILHRIVQIDGPHLTLEGDGNYRIREHCQQQDVLAVMRKVIRRNGTEIDCSTSHWRNISHAWRILPPFLRRSILAILFRIGWR